MATTHVKYMGAADRRVIDKGTDFGGRLANPTENDLEWNHENNFVVDVKEAGLSKEAVELLLADDDFKDISDLKTIPPSVAQLRRAPSLGRVSADEVEQLNDDSDSKSTKTSSSSSGGTTSGGSTSSSSKSS